MDSRVAGNTLLLICFRQHYQGSYLQCAATTSETSENKTHSYIMCLRSLASLQRWWMRYPFIETILLIEYRRPDCPTYPYTMLNGRIFKWKKTRHPGDHWHVVTGTSRSCETRFTYVTSSNALYLSQCDNFSSFVPDAARSSAEPCIEPGNLPRSASLAVCLLKAVALHHR